MIETISKFCIVCGDDTTFGKVCEGCEYDLQQLHNAQYSAQISDLKPFRDRKTREIGEYSQALAMMEQASILAPDSALIALNYAIIAEETGEHDLAKKYY